MSEVANSQYSDDQGSFVTGFSLGIFAGAVGYFLFATDRGVTLRKELSAEWQAAKQQLHSEHGEAAVGEMKGWLKRMVWGVSDAFQAAAPVSKAAKHKKTSNSHRESVPKKVDKFKNV